MQTVQQAIKHSLSNFDQGSIIFPADFRMMGSQDAIKMALSRLVKSGEIKRIAHGIYYKPVIHPQLGELLPPAEAVAEHLAEKERVRIRPAGAFALHKLGLSTQVPTKLVYLTDGPPRKFKIANVSIEFKATTPKKMALSSTISGMLVLAMEELDIEHINKTTEEKILHILQFEKRGDLEHNLKLAPGRIYDYLIKLLKRLDENSLFLSLKTHQ